MLTACGDGGQSSLNRSQTDDSMAPPGERMAEVGIPDQEINLEEERKSAAIHRLGQALSQQPADYVIAYVDCVLLRLRPPEHPPRPGVLAKIHRSPRLPRPCIAG